MEDLKLISTTHLKTASSVVCKPLSRANAKTSLAQVASAVMLPMYMSKKRMTFSTIDNAGLPVLLNSNKYGMSALSC